MIKTKLYYQDSHLREFTAQVVDCRWEEKRGCYGVVLDRTAFFPEGGGQYADTGILGDIQVQDVQEKDGQIVHYLAPLEGLTKPEFQENAPGENGSAGPAFREAACREHLHVNMEAGEAPPLKPGTQVEGHIDYVARFWAMQQHTGEHIISGLVHRHFGYDNVGFHLGRELVTMDFNGVLTPENLRRIEQEANEAVFQNIAIQVSYPAREELDALEYLSKKELEGQVRIVTIPGYDVCACCAPHVERTGEIGLIKLIDGVKYKGGTRVTMVCGFRALKDYQEKETSVRDISHLLSAKPGEVAAAVQRLQEEVQQWKTKLVRAQNIRMDEKLAAIGDHTEHVIVFEPELDKHAARRFVDTAMRRCTGICALFLGNDTDGYQYTIGSQSIDLKAFLRDFHGIYAGKGGGKGEMVQGTVSGKEDGLREYISGYRI